MLQDQCPNPSRLFGQILYPFGLLDKVSILLGFGQSLYPYALLGQGFHYTIVFRPKLHLSHLLDQSPHASDLLG